MGVKKYRKKPVVIEAVQWIGKNLDEVKAFCGEDARLKADVYAAGELVSADLFISTLEGDMHASIGDYIIKGINGEFYPCKPDIFDNTYEEVSD